MGSLRSLAFLTPGNFPDDDPFSGLDATLDLFVYGEGLGFDGAWIRQRHLEHGVGSAAVLLAAASQRTSRIHLGAAVIPIGYESPFRLAEDLSLADVLSRGRLQIGFSAGPPPHADLLGDLVFDGDWRNFDLGYGRIERLLANLRGEYLGGPDTVIHSPGNTQRPRLQPYSPGLEGRIWYGGGSSRSVRWAGANGLGLLTGNIVSGERSDDFVTAQSQLIAEFSAFEQAGPIAVGRVIVPLDGADRRTRKRYQEYARSRHDRTRKPHGERRTLFAPDMVGTATEIVERLHADPVVATATALRLELPYEFDREDYEQILADTATLIAPHLGWPGAATR
ncbi:LLM class flavin-dependent oxidoreductase [Actinoplanes utahensis]|uniref:Oxidoreductase n=1 Tax=Actinoplanes utahensis TaxID=1869 RepID=A0A0A6U8D8_ACTUT|nr:LLM class flavin-dependent oxidoreductase [Actinoplanes utahensis]KHD72280.1 oxidoreductase [Actinoplanes utahensis]GIF35567.1 monooxygenase [Actinoplanes utahensis]